MHVKRIHTAAELAGLAPAWEQLAGRTPFLSGDWLTGWWRHYGASLPDAELSVLGVFDGNTLLGLAPWYIERQRQLGRVIRFLGTGEVCSDYLSVPCERGSEEPVAGALSRWLVDEHPAEITADGAARWDVLELTDVDPRCEVVPRLANLLADEGCPVDRRTGPNCWRLQLPESWEAYVSQLSKSHRKQVRRLERDLTTSGRAAFHTVMHSSELDEGWNILVELHQRRRQSLGEPGCFSSPQFAAFHRAVAEAFLRAGRLRLHWLEWDGRPIAAEYHLAGDDAVYAYQAGIDPDALQVEPGRLISIAVIRQAIAEGRRAIDFLRGDEPYKAHWRAEPRASLEFRIASRRLASRCRHGAWLAQDRMKQWVKGYLTPDTAAS